jgi:uncharacterized protein YigE (DUF2233 family)
VNRRRQCFAALALAATIASAGTPSAARAVVISPFASSLVTSIAPAVLHDRGAYATEDGTQAVHLVEVDPGDPAISLEASLSNGSMTGLETVRNHALRESRDGHRVIAALNGDVWSGFDATDPHEPKGLHVEDGELMSAVPLAKPTVGFLDDDHAIIGAAAVAIAIAVDGGPTIEVDGVNKDRLTGQSILFTGRWGPATLELGGRELVLGAADLPLRPSGTWQATVQENRRPAVGQTIPAGSLVLSSDGLDGQALATVAIGTSVTIRASATSGWGSVDGAVSGREWLIRDGQTWIEPRPASADQVHPRSAVGIRADGSLIFATVDGRQSGYSTGVALEDLAALLATRGAVDAINLDGGGSTTMAVRLPGDREVSVVNRPSDGNERPVTNSILVVTSAPTGTLSQLVVRPAEATVVAGATATFRAYGMDRHQNAVYVAPSRVTWTTSRGAVDASGRFRSITTGRAVVTASVGSLRAEAEVVVAPDTFAPTTPSLSVAPASDGTVSATSAALMLAWTPARDVGLGLRRYDLQRSLDGGAWTAVTLAQPLGTRQRVAAGIGHIYRYRIRAVDRAGNASGWRTLPTVRVRTFAETTALGSVTGTWTTVTGTDFLGGRARYSRSRGATASFSAEAWSIAWITAVGPDRGRADVFVDGTLVKTVDLLRTVRGARRIGYVRSWSTLATHTVTVRVAGTVGRPRVDVDGWLILDSPPVPISVTAPATPSTTPAPIPTATPVPAPSASASATPMPMPEPTPISSPTATATVPPSADPMPAAVPSPSGP